MNIIFDLVTRALRRQVGLILLAGWTLVGLAALGAAGPVLPTVTITTPAAGARHAAPVAFAGTAAERGSAAITSVNYWITNLTFSGSAVLSGQAVVSAGTGTAFNWNFSLAPLAGSNVLAVQSQDGFGNSSTVVTRKFFVLEQAELTVSVSNSTNTPSARIIGYSLIKGDTAPGSNAMLNIGEPYVIEAVTAFPNTFFLNWTGTGLVPVGKTNTAELEFIMQPNSVLQANFLTNMFLNRAGTYWGLFSDSTDNIGGPTEETAGMIANFVVNTRGGYSGSIYLGGVDSIITGLFTPDGYASNRIVITNLDSNVVVQLQLLTNVATNAPAPIIVGSVIGTNVIQLQDNTSQAGWTSSVTVFAPMLNTSNFARSYTMLLHSNPDANSTAAPAVGTGFAYLTNYVGAPPIYPNMVTLNGLLGDWTSFAESAPINVQSNIPIYQDYINTPNPGMLFGWLQLSAPGTSPPTLICTNLTWIRKQAGYYGIYTNGFTNHPVVQASYWSNTMALTNYLPAKSPMTLSSPDLVDGPDITFHLSITNIYGLVGDTNTFHLGSINTNTGRFSFTFTNGYGVGHYAYGMLLQNTNSVVTNGEGLAGGLFILGSLSIPTNIGNIVWHP